MPPTLAINIPWTDMALSDHRDHLARLIDAGYREVWTGESDGFDVITPLAVVAGWFPGIRVGCGIANTFLRGPTLLAMATSALCQSGADHVRLGLGPGTAVFAERWNGVSFEQPGRRVTETLRFLRDVLGNGRSDASYDLLGVRGVRLSRPPTNKPSLFVGALGPKLQRLAAAEADGLMLSLVTVNDVHRIATELSTVERDAPGDLDLIATVFVVPDDDREIAERSARSMLAAYLSVPGYAHAQRRADRGEMLRPVWEHWERGDRSGAAEAVPQALLDDLIVFGSPGDCHERLSAFAAAGLDTAVVTVLPVEGQDPARRTDYLTQIAKEAAG